MKQIWHPWDEWECYKAGFWNSSPPDNMTDNDCHAAYKNFLADLSLFESNIIKVFREWPKSCENFLTNVSINRVAWIGQSAMCIHSGVPSKYKSGYQLLTDEQKVSADNLARTYLNQWIQNHEAKNI